MHFFIQISTTSMWFFKEKAVGHGLFMILCWPLFYLFDNHFYGLECEISFIYRAGSCLVDAVQTLGWLQDAIKVGKRGEVGCQKLSPLLTNLCYIPPSKCTPWLCHNQRERIEIGEDFGVKAFLTDDRPRSSFIAQLRVKMMGVLRNNERGN